MLLFAASLVSVVLERSPGGPASIEPSDRPGQVAATVLAGGSSPIPLVAELLRAP